MSYLVVNSGSSTIKIAIFSEGTDGAMQRQLHGMVDRHNVNPRLRLLNAEGEVLVDTPLSTPRGDHGRALEAVLKHCDRFFGHEGLVAAGHRVVHGGVKFSEPLRVDAGSLAELEALTPLAPQHQPYNLAGIYALQELRPDLAQIACFDTEFHRTMPQVAQRFALPREWFERGVLRYGFHGLSYEYIASRLAQLDPEAAHGRAVVAHLGHGASVCALSGGVSVATSMGFTALDGLPMGTRCGSLDPGVVLYLLQQKELSASEVSHMLYERAGLRGVSGISDDMRELLASRAPEAEEAIELFVYRTVCEIGQLMAALGGMDALVFTGGIGEHAAPVRARILAALGWLGVRVDTASNDANALSISADGSAVRVWVIPTDEELVIAEHCRRIVSSERASS